MSNKLAEQLLVEAVLQIRYLGEKFGETGSGNAIAARIETYLASTTNSSNTACDAVGQEKFGKAKYQFLVGRDKPFFIDTFRSLLNQYDKEEISLSKVVEELNVQAYKWHLGRHGLTPDDADKIYGITDADIDEKVKKLNSMQASKAEPKPSLSWVKASERYPNHTGNVITRYLKDGEFIVEQNTVIEISWLLQNAKIDLEWLEENN